MFSITTTTTKPTDQVVKRVCLSLGVKAPQNNCPTTNDEYFDDSDEESDKDEPLVHPRFTYRLQCVLRWFADIKSANVNTSINLQNSIRPNATRGCTRPIVVDLTESDNKSFVAIAEDSVDRAEELHILQDGNEESQVSTSIPTPAFGVRSVEIPSNVEARQDGDSGASVQWAVPMAPSAILCAKKRVRSNLVQAKIKDLTKRGVTKATAICYAPHLVRWQVRISHHQATLNTFDSFRNLTDLSIISL